MKRDLVTNAGIVGSRRSEALLASRSRHHSHRRSALLGWQSSITLEDGLREINGYFTHRLSQEGMP